MQVSRRTGSRWSPHAAIPWVVAAFLPMAVWAAAPAGVDADAPEATACGDVAMSAPASYMVVCDSGGDGATACETKRTMTVGPGIGWVSGCGISCNVGYYACCQEPRLSHTAHCQCFPDPYQPSTPNLPPEGPSLPVQS